MNHKLTPDSLDMMSFMNGLVFFSPVALLVRTQAGISVSTFFILQVLLSFTIFALEIPTGKLSDRLGYRKTLIISEILLCLSRMFLLAAYRSHIMILFIIQVFLEGIAACLSSGTQSAYIYSVVDENSFVIKTARVSNYGTLGFVLSTIGYIFLYHIGGIDLLLTATVISGILGILFSVGLKKEHTKTNTNTEHKFHKATSIKNIMNKKTIAVIALVSCVNLSFILINFFYVDKLQICHVDVSYMAPIILGYSVIQLLSEVIIRIFNKKSIYAFFRLMFVLLGFCMILFGYISLLIPVIALMLLMPLQAEIIACILDKIQNDFIDESGYEAQRAEMMSIFNMGVNIIEIIFLLGAAFITNVGPQWSYCVFGTIMIIIGILSVKFLKN